ncbi:MAG: ROK family transcriptional regulator [Terracoccus sp.]
MAPKSGPRGALAAHRGLLIDAIRGAGQVSRASLARKTGLNAATVTLAVRDLLADGLIVETGLAPSTGGKPAVLLALANESRFAVGVHLDHTSITYVVANLSGGVIDRQFSRGGADAGDPQRVVEQIASEITTFIRRAGIDRERLVGIGLVSPGPATSARGIALSSPEMRPWVDFPLVTALANAAGLPVVLGNDASASAIGEYWSGHAKATDVFATVYMGTGIGSGIVVAGQPLIGSSGNAGEVGHTCVVMNGDRCWCGGDGCLETVAGAAAIVAQARAAGLNPAGEFLDEQFADVARAALRDSPVAVRIFEDAAHYVAVAVQSLANILDLDRVILTGPSFGIAGALYVPTIRRRLELAFFARNAHAIEVTMSANATVAAATGAAAMVLQRELAPVPAMSGRAAIVVVGSEPTQRPGAAASSTHLSLQGDHVAS